MKSILPGCEPGVEFYDRLTDALNYEYKNDTRLSTARRNKYDMGETIRNAGIRAVKQIYTDSWNEVLEFIESVRQDKLDPNNFKVVLKPVDSAGADGVYMAASIDEAKQAFDTILGSNTIFETVNSKVLVQEYLKGTEYVVDSMSYQGEHRCTALWKYDKRRANESQFVYYGVFLYEETLDNVKDSPFAMAGNEEAIREDFENKDQDPSIASLEMMKDNSSTSKDGYEEYKVDNHQNQSNKQERSFQDILVEYTHECLIALGINNGPSHAEVMWLEDENRPCLVEVGARAHGG